MIIAHNMLAMNGNRQLGINNRKAARSAERLGSGYRVNRSADDAAGLSISEKMRAQIRGLNRASTNGQEAISLIQTAEGALNEVHAMLQRMEELSVQAANDTNTEKDRAIIKEEIDQLCHEIDHISDTTHYNTLPVLKVPQLVELPGGSFQNASLDQKYRIQNLNGGTRDVNGISMDFANVTANRLPELSGKSFRTTCTANCNQVFTFKFTDASVSTATVNGDNLTVEIGLKSDNIKSGSDVVNEIINQVKSKQSEAPFNGYGSSDLYIGHANGITANGSALILYSTYGGPPYADGMGLLKAGDMFVEEQIIHFQIGANEEQSMEYAIRTINTDTLGLTDLDVSSYEDAGGTITKVQTAIESVSEYRSYIGAKQNRLEHSIRNSDNASENLQAAESLIRDANMADEMVELSKDNILMQVGQSILAQSNQASQGVLNLLK